MNEPFEYVCECGTTHTIDGDKLERIFEKGKEVMVVCGKCSRTTIIYADAEPDYWTDKNDYIPFARSFADIRVLEPRYDGKGIVKIMSVDGIHNVDFECNINPKI